MSSACPTEIVRQMEECCRALVQVADRAVDAPLVVLEAEVLAVVRAALPQLLGAVLRQSQRSLWPTRSRATACCPRCGSHSNVQSWRPRCVLTICGPVQFERPWCSCSQCGRGFSPTDQSLALGSGQRLSAGVQQWVSSVGATTSFRAAAALLGQLTGVRLAPETVRRTTEAQGAELEAQEQAAAQQVATQGEATVRVNPAPGRLVVEVDGVMVRYRDGWHEVKVGLAGGYVAGKLLAKSYTAARATPEQFGPRLLAEAARRGALDVVAWEGSPLQRRLAVLREVTVVGDGAPWIWNLAAGHFGERVEVVDWYHASEHLWTVAKALHGEAAAAPWAERRLNELWEEGPAPVQAALAAARPATPEAAEILRREQGYFRTNATRMQYPQLRASALPLGSGAVESAARHVVQQRLKRAGCRWSEAGAQAVLNLCCRRATSLTAA